MATSRNLKTAATLFTSTAQAFDREADRRLRAMLIGQRSRFSERPSSGGA